MLYKTVRGQDGLCRAYRGKAEKGKAPVALYPAERARHGGRALALQAKQEGVALQVFTACLEKWILCHTE